MADGPPNALYYRLQEEMKALARQVQEKNAEREVLIRRQEELQHKLEATQAQLKSKSSQQTETKEELSVKEKTVRLSSRLE